MKKEKRQRRRYTQEFKQDAVALVTEQGYSIAEAARSLDISDTILRRWRDEFVDQFNGDALTNDEREELRRLRRENRELKMEKEILKKASAYFGERNEVKYAFIQEQVTLYPVTLLCRITGVTHSSYYDWRRRGPKVIPAGEMALRRRMKELFIASRESLGSRTLMENLQSEGFEVGRDKVRRLMKSMKLKVRKKRKYKITTDSKHNLPVAENMLDRRFNPEKPNQAWGADITYVWTQEGWLYLAVIIDLYSRRVVGWCIDKRMSKSLVIRALMMAINLRNPPAGLIHHSDRGSQYASKAYQALLQQHGIICSMSRKGNCWDNAPVERFFSSLKREWTGDRLYRTRKEAIADVREYVAVYYNARRLHSTLGYKSPVDFEKDLNNVSGIG
ncbi:MAG: IS3 family transposase [Gammaproteobacteria bacterium]|nr:MAG: IS3 family transposase [Gammaproteobacteria bacterium]